jgi:hypothetical protein
MIRKLVFVAVGALVCPTLSFAPAGAAPAPPAGALNCGTSGTAAFRSAGLPAATASTGNTTLRAEGTIDACDASGVTGGVLAINSGTIEMTGTIPPGATCASVFSTASSILKLKVTVTLTNTTVNSHGHTVVKRVATLRPVRLTLTPEGSGFAFTGELPQNTKGSEPFGNEIVFAQLNFDNFAAAQNCAQGGSSLASVQWSTAGASVLSVVNASPRPTGVVACGSTGTAALERHGIPAGAPSLFTIEVAATATADACDASNVTGGNGTINGGTFLLKTGIRHGVSCSTLFTAPIGLIAPRITLTLEHQSTNAFGYHVARPVATVRAFVDTITDVGNGFLLKSDALRGSSAFAGDQILLLIQVDNLGDVSNCAAGTAPLTTIQWSSAGGSGVALAPLP